jgi:hypothetical protein
VSRALPNTRRGYAAYECVSAFQKSVRRSMVREAVYWGYELWKSSYDAWAWARIHEIVSEDIGPADRHLPATIEALERISKHKKKTKNAGGMEFVHAVILLASAPKSGIACYMVMKVDSDHHERLEIPDEALDQHTRRGRQLGRGWEHFRTEGNRFLELDVQAQAQGYPDAEAYLKALDDEAREHANVRFEGSAEQKEALPQNPWQPRADSSPESWVPPDAGKKMIRVRIKGAEQDAELVRFSSDGTKAKVKIGGREPWVPAADVVDTADPATDRETAP